VTHDELLTRLKEGQWVDKDEMHRRSNALRAVVELHKPKEQVTSMNVTTGKVFSTQTICTQCSEGLGVYATIYPCPTIQAIEREIK
jgi:hypothetical protein